MRKVLLIEDDTVLRENTAELLELSDFKVITAANGKAGAEAAINSLPDIIICDIMMPELDGYGVLEALSKHDNTKYIPFVFLSAKTEHQDIRKGMNLGADDYITKPFTEDELVSAIESRLARAAILKDIRAPHKKKNVAFYRDELKTLNDLKKFFDDNGQTFVFAKGDSIYEEGQHSNIIYLVRKGMIKCYRFDENGKEFITALHKEDELFGYTSFVQNVPYQESATAMSNAELAGITKRDFKTILDNNHNVTLELMSLLTDNLSYIKEQLLQIAYSSVNKKTANTILKFAEKLNKSPGEPIRISRNDLASVAGIATETLIRTLSEFKKNGIIKTEGRNIKIVDIKKLKQIR